MKISVISPCRNEFKFIDEFLNSVLNQELNHDLEIIVSDGMSDDGTRSKLDQWSLHDPRVKVIDNPGKIVSTGLNKAIEIANGEIIVRMDIHTTYASNYIHECVHSLEYTGAKCVGGPWHAKGNTLKQQAIANAFQSRFGSGGAASRNLNYSGPVDTVYLGAWYKKDLIKIGGFDRDLVRNQDDELCLRITRDGGRIWQSSTIQSTYTPRSSFKALFRQFYQYGYWKALVLKKHRIPASPRHLAPFFFVALLSILALLSPLSHISATAFSLISMMYVSASGIFAWPVRGNTGIIGVIYTALSCWAMHFGYGIGFARGLVNFIFLNRGPEKSMQRLTR